MTTQTKRNSIDDFFDLKVKLEVKASGCWTLTETDGNGGVSKQLILDSEESRKCWAGQTVIRNCQWYAVSTFLRRNDLPAGIYDARISSHDWEIAMRPVGEAFINPSRRAMPLSFNFLGYTTVDCLQDLSGSMFTIEPSELGWGTIAIASALSECVNAGTVVGWPYDLDPKATDGSRRFIYEAEYKELLEECQAALDWQAESNPDGDFEEACLWVRVNFE